ncbi:hypothetical protein L3556_01925 [Candidatus Synechococcus calcipolaris G9]|uniref:Uncharacterized protein n=1 Tax=Candidatus Synechococcus calcipolaris G9 TaxID=1497997 RepID=A0ABT6EV41_9SYNE|nr:hypothetical protein [Candidatus Synechococcus calcipolaris]MDG2989697.1 hypothetical protein [Candidatus Synechococcus calcipolaris G9]
MAANFLKKLNWTLSDWVGLTITAIALGVIATMQQTSLEELKDKSQQVLSKEAYERQDAQTEAQINLLANIPAFGFENLISDWSFLQFLQYFGYWQAREKTGYDLSPDFFKVIINNDPRFVNSYVFLSTSSTLYAGQPQESVALMDQGLANISPKTFPQAYLIWVYRAMDELLFLGDPQASAKSYEMAAQWSEIQKDPDIYESAPFYRRMAEGLVRNPNSRQVQFNSWMLVLSNSVSDRTRELALKNLRELGAVVTISPEGTINVQPPPTD